MPTARTPRLRAEFRIFLLRDDAARAHKSQLVLTWRSQNHTLNFVQLHRSAAVGSCKLLGCHHSCNASSPDLDALKHNVRTS